LKNINLPGETQMPKHLKDLENRIHEGCGFYLRDNRRILLPGHIVLPTESFVDFASYVILGGVHGWQGACPCAADVRKVIEAVSTLNPDSLTDPAAPNRVGRQEAAAVAGKGPSRLLTDEAFYAMFKEKFANWKPTAQDMGRLPEPVRKYMTALLDKADPEDKAMAYVAQVDENKKLQQQIMEYRQKLLAKDKEIAGLGDYITEVERKLATAEAVASESALNLATCREARVNAEQDAQDQRYKQEALADEAAKLRSDLHATQEELTGTQETLKSAEDLLNQSEEARERQDERFRPGATARAEDAEQGQAEEVEGNPQAEEPEAPQRDTASGSEPD
jgi:hypothetical protein